MLMIGSPGTGKSMLAKRLPTILPPLTPAESLETTRIKADHVVEAISYRSLDRKLWTR
jgi:predicted ATPase with chaperone activity